jgi:glycosyltransferase involved in cell wall biosynthesis
MIIGFDGSRAFTPLKTGTENYSYQLLIHLAKVDHKNTYVVFLRPNTDISGFDWPDNFEFVTLEYPRLWTQLGLAVQTFKRPLDVLFTPAHTLPIIYKPGLKTLITVHDLGAEYLPQLHQWKQRLYLNFMTHHQLRSATHLIAVSEFTKKDLIRKVGVPAKDITVIYEGFNTMIPKNDSLVNINQQYDISKDEYFLFIGTIQPRKNIERLIKSFAAYKSNGGKVKDLVLAGSKGWLSDDIYSLPQTLGIEASVKFLGYVPDEHLYSLYKQATGFVFPSLFEGFGLPVLEAMSCHCPVMTSNTTSLPEVAGDAAIYVDPLSVTSITDGLFKLSDPSVRLSLIRKGIVQAEGFDWKKTAIQTLEVIQDFANTK